MTKFSISDLIHLKAILESDLIHLKAILENKLADKSAWANHIDYIYDKKEWFRRHQVYLQDPNYEKLKKVNARIKEILDSV